MLLKKLVVGELVLILDPGKNTPALGSGLWTQMGLGKHFHPSLHNCMLEQLLKDVLSPLSLVGTSQSSRAIRASLPGPLRTLAPTAAALLDVPQSSFPTLQVWSQPETLNSSRTHLQVFPGPSGQLPLPGGQPGEQIILARDSVSLLLDCVEWAFRMVMMS